VTLVEGIRRVLDAILLRRRGGLAQVSDADICDWRVSFGNALTEDARAFLASCDEQLGSKQETFRETWLTDFQHEDAGLERGLLRLSHLNRPPVTFDAKLIGTFDRRHRKWEWSWNDRSVSRRHCVPRALLEPIVAQYNLTYLTVGAFRVPNEQFPQYASAISLKLTNALAVYELVTGHLVVFLLLDSPRVSGA